MLDWLGCDTTCRKIPSFNFEFSFLVYTHGYKYIYLCIYMIKPQITPSPIHIFILEEEARNCRSALTLMLSNISGEVRAITLPAGALKMQICGFCLLSTIKNNHFPKSQRKYQHCHLLSAGACPAHTINNAGEGCSGTPESCKKKVNQLSFMKMLTGKSVIVYQFSPFMKKLGFLVGSGIFY